MRTKEKSLRRPGKLLRGDAIGIVAPAGPFNVKRFNRGIEVLKSMGFFPLISEDLFLKKGYLAGTDRHRAEMVNRLFAEPNIKAIFSAKGGFGTMRILSLLDFNSIRGNPKIFVGFSDITALLSVLNNSCGMVTFHGPVVTTLADATDETKTSLFRSLTSDMKIEIKPRKGVTINPGKTSGPLEGGNLTTLCHLTGTPYTPNFKGKILLIEDKGEALYRIDRMLTQMILSGCFEGLGGIVIGSFEDCGEVDGVYRLIEEMFKDFNIPVLAGFEVGHSKTNITIPMGIRAELDADRQRVTFHETATLDK
jgi:muramoyltetrapeptide carboxypeptidase